MGLWIIPALRHTALVLLVLTILMVFLWDMGGLTGLYRVASFIGLGGSLLAIGYIYRRFVYRQNDKSGP